jgi:hypothetical protein
MPVVNPFQQINASLPPLVPAPPEPALGFNPSDMDTGAPTPMPQGKRPQVFGPTPQDRQQTMLGGRLEQDYQKDLHPWGTPDNHPGIWGKIGHALSVATGGPNRRLMEESGIEGKLNKLAELQSQDAYRGAETGKTEEETAEAPGKAQSEEQLQGAEAGHATAETDALKNPPMATVETDQGIFLRNPKTNELTPLTYQGKPLNPFVKTPPKGMEKVDLVGPDGKPMAADFHPDTGKYSDSTGKEIANPKPYEKPNQAGMITMIAPDPNTPGGGIVERLGAGAHIAPGSQTAAGVNSMNTPTTLQRNAGGRADIVLSAIPDVLNDLRQNASQLGPGMGRFNDIYSGKIGAPNPEFSGLMADLHLLGTAVALAHAQGRMSNELLTEFNSMIASPQQSPANIEAVLSKVQKFMQRASEQGKRPNDTSGGAAQGGAEPKVLKFNQQTGRLE